jgi:hypothetical protein
MFRNVISISSILIVLLTVNLTGQNSFLKTYGGKGDEEGRSSIVTKDGGIILTGFSNSNDGDFNKMNKGGIDIIVVKLDQNGNILWKYNFGGWGSDYGNYITETMDGGCIITGYTSSNDGDFGGFNKGSNDIVVIRLDRNGSLLWKKLFGGTGDDRGNSIIVDREGNFVVTGSTTSNDGDIQNNKGNSDIFLMKLDSNGKIIWCNTIGGKGEDLGFSVCERNDDTYTLTGYTRSNDGDFGELFKGGEFDIIVIDINHKGMVTMKKTYGGLGYESGLSIKKVDSNSVLVSGYQQSNDGDFRQMNKGWEDLFIMKLDSIGNIIWKKTFGGPNYDGGRSISVTTDGNILVTGYTNSLNYGDFSVFSRIYSENYIVLLILDPNGELITKRIYGGTRNDYGRSINHLSNGDIIITGGSNSTDDDFNNLNIGNYDFFLLKLDSKGNLKNTTSINEFSEPSTTLSVYPNPFSNTTTISYKVETPSNISIELLNTLGQTIEVLRNDYSDSGTYQLPLNVSTLTSGMYSVRMRSGSNSMVVPVWVVK